MHTMKRRVMLDVTAVNLKSCLKKTFITKVKTAIPVKAEVPVECSVMSSLCRRLYQMYLSVTLRMGGSNKCTSASYLFSATRHFRYTVETLRVSK